MRVATSWLKTYIDAGLPVEELAERLTIAGIEVEGIESSGAESPKVVAGRVLAVEALKPGVNLLTVDAGERVQIVSAAPNLSAESVGQSIALALPGAVVVDADAGIPKLRTVAAGTLYGKRSQGVGCSERELGISGDHSGVMLLPPKTAPGTPLRELDLPRAPFGADHALELAILPNIARCQSMIGVAREVAAVTGAPLDDALALHPVDFEHSELDPESDDDTLCTRFYAALVEGVRVTESPDWVQNRLVAAGQKPINNVVDASNYVMLELGQPTHCYDADTLPALKLGVRRSRVGERLLPIVHDEGEAAREVPEGVPLIVSDDRPVALAGVMGGADTQVSEQSTRILVESANFDFIAIRRSQHAVQIHSESSARFSRAVDPALARKGVRRLLAVLAETCPELVVRQTGLWDTGGAEDRRIAVTVARVNHLLGTELDAATVQTLLERAGFSVQSDGRELVVTVDSSRLDVSIQADLVEEIARLHGYDALPGTLPIGEMPQHPRAAHILARTATADALASAGLQEILSYSMSTPELHARLLLGRDGHQPGPFIKLLNPDTAHRTVMRRSLLPAMLETTAANLRHSAGVHLFEQGIVVRPELAEPGAERPAEPWRLAIVMVGSSGDEGLGESPRELDFSDLNAAVQALLDRLHLDGVERVVADAAPFHPGICARLQRGDQVFGHLGALHPSVAEAFDMAGLRVWAADLDLDALLAQQVRFVSIVEPPTHPSIDIDIAVIVDEAVLASTLLGVVRDHAGPLLTDCTVFDVYRGEPIPAGSKAVGVRLWLNGGDRTLAMEEARAVREQVVQALRDAVGAEPRE